MKLINGLTDPKTLLDLLLKNRSIKREDYHDFLTPPLPKNFLKLKKALTLIKNHLSKNILIYGDYDVDGITSTSLLYQAIKPKNSSTFVFLPHRQIDGYGFKADSFFKFEQNLGLKFDLLITIDNGIAAGPEFLKLKKTNSEIKILVIDHHLKNDQSSPADVIVHSTETSAAGLAYFIAKEINLQADLGIAALGVIADCLPLVGINRSIVVHGLNSLRVSPPLALKLLFDSANIKPDSVSVYDLSFIVAPRLNAAGRLDDPSLAFLFLNSENRQDAAKFLQILNAHNQNRQDQEKKSLQLVENTISRDVINHVSTSRFIFVSDPSFHPGIIGLIAGRLTEKYHLPSIVISQGPDVAKGSCRSISGIDITSILRRYLSLFIDLGGHSAAAGFSITPQNISRLQKKLTAYFAKTDQIKIDHLVGVDAQMDPVAVTIKNIKYINLLAPFGIGNPTPTFYFKDLLISSLRQLGPSKDHLKINFNNLNAIAFRQGKLFGSLKIGQTISLIASLDLNTWNNITSPQLIIKEIILPDSESLPMI